MGTKISNLQVTKVVDGDTIKVDLDGEETTLRLVDVDTEESQTVSGKPLTQAGIMATAMAKEYFQTPTGDLIQVDIEFDSDHPVEECLKRYLGNYGRLLCYVHKDGENYNLKLIQEGWSPYFVKYGRSRLYHKEMTQAEAEAQANNRVIWDPLTNAGGPERDYGILLPWWAQRAQLVEDYRLEGVPAGVLSVRLDYEEICTAADNEETKTIFCDLQGGINQWTGNGALVYAGSVTHKFNLWIPNADTESSIRIIQLIEKRYAGEKRGYVYVTGKVQWYSGKPEIVLTDVAQLSDFPA